MTIEQINTLIEQLENQAQQNIMNHQALLGRLAQAKDFKKSLEDAEKAAESVEVVEGEVV